MVSSRLVTGFGKMRLLLKDQNVSEQFFKSILLRNVFFETSKNLLNNIFVYDLSLSKIFARGDGGNR